MRVAHNFFVKKCVANIVQIWQIQDEFLVDEGMQ